MRSFFRRLLTSSIFNLFQLISNIMADIIQNNEPESYFNKVIVQAKSLDNSFLLTNSERVPLNSLKR